jgi:uncharacterized delta-60 repeat protein
VTSSQIGPVATVTTDIAGGWERAAAVAAAPEGGVYVVGSTGEADSLARGHDFLVARYASDGTLVSSFGNGGIAKEDFGAGESGEAVGVQADGRLVVAGTSESEDRFGSDVVVARYLPDGALDRSFSADGVRQISVEALHTDCATPTDLVIDSRDRILVAGSLGCGGEGGLRLRGLLIRLLPDGSVDRSFVRRGIDHVCYVAALALREDGRILITGPRTAAGQQDAYCEYRVTSAVVRLGSNGELDRSFGDRAQAKLEFRGTRSLYAADLLLDARGRPLVVGSAGVRGGDVVGVARLTRGGRYDRSFAVMAV